MISSNPNTPRKYEYLKISTPLYIIIFVIFIGSFGYHFIWRDYSATWIDSLYMTLITITTIGFGEIYPLHTFGRIFTLFIAILGISSLFYLFSTIMENLVLIQLLNYKGIKKMKRTLNELNNHIIVVGYGRVGRLTVNELFDKKEQFVVINNNFNEFTKDYLNDDVLFIDGDATEDITLQRAGIDRARGIIIVTADPATTVFVALSAKVLNPNIYIIARCDDEQSSEKLKRAGADRVVNPYEIGGKTIANMVMNRHLVDFFEASFSSDLTISIQSIEIVENDDFIHKSIKQLDLRNKFGVTVLAIVRNNSTFYNPSSDYILIEKDKIVAMGNPESFHLFNRNNL